MKEHHVLFVTAHPDDEIMFFFPTISAIAKDYHTHILCLSHGATEREAELGEVTRSLGLFKSKCLHNEQMIDGQK